MAWIIEPTVSFKKNHPLSLDSFFGIRGKFIPAQTVVGNAQQRNIMPKVDGEDVDPKLSFGPEEPKNKFDDENNEQHKNNAEVKDLIGEVLHFDEDMINHHGLSAATRNLPVDHHANEDDWNEPASDEKHPATNEDFEEEKGFGEVKETVESNDHDNIEKEEYVKKGREENVQFNKLMGQFSDDPSVTPFHQPEDEEYKEYKSKSRHNHRIGLPLPARVTSGNNNKLHHSKKGSCPHPRCDVMEHEDFEGGHFEPPGGEEEVPYEGESIVFSFLWERFFVFIQIIYSVNISFPSLNINCYCLLEVCFFQHQFRIMK